mgnify:CR=1 FL=1
MRKYAIYRIHYGLDFLGKSIESIMDQVDKVFVFWSKKPWFKGCKNLPPMNENIAQFCKDKDYRNVVVFEREYDKPDNQFKKIYDEVCQYYPRPDQILMMEPDMVWDKNELKKIWELKDNEISFKQIEFWKNEEWYIKRDRPGPTLYNGTVNSTLKGCWSDKRKTHDTIKCFNYGFCLSPEVMKYKHEVAIQSSKYYGDSQPSVEWYEKKWLNWTPETEDLEISEAHRHYIKKAYPYGTKD